MEKYRIVQKGDKYNPQTKVFLFWCKHRHWYNEIWWMSKQKACSLVSEWRTNDIAANMPLTIHKPEDLCKGG